MSEGDTKAELQRELQRAWDENREALLDLTAALRRLEQGLRAYPHRLTSRARAR